MLKYIPLIYSYLYIVYSYSYILLFKTLYVNSTYIHTLCKLCFHDPVPSCQSSTVTATAACVPPGCRYVDLIGAKRTPHTGYRQSVGTAAAELTPAHSSAAGIFHSNSHWLGLNQSSYSSPQQTSAHRGHWWCFISESGITGDASGLTYYLFPACRR